MRRVSHSEIKSDYSKIFSTYLFEWFATLTFKYSVSQDIARKRLLDWLREICVKEALQIACLAVFNEQTRGHWHVAMLGKNAGGKTLRDVPVERWDNAWGTYKVADNAKVEVIYDLSGVSKYMAKNMVTLNPDKADLFMYNKKLLNKCRNVPRSNPGNQVLDRDEQKTM